MAIPVPAALVRAIRDGDCVAFVGAGFSAAAGMPGWRELLARVAGLGEPGRPADVAALDALLASSAPTGRDLEIAAQLLQDALGPARYRRRMARALAHRGPIPPAMARRIERLTGIPFRAILTTNFDPLLPGRTPAPDTYRLLLRPRSHRWWDRRYWPGPDGRAEGPLVVKLHGDLAAAPPAPIVSTRREYRSRLHGDPAYVSTLRSVLATTTVLYLGYSLSDAYLDEVRGQLLQAMGDRPDVPILAWAVLPDVSPLEVAYYARHEGIALLGYPSDPAHVAFDTFLDHLYERTNPIHILADRLRGRRVLWMDPNDAWNEAGMRFLGRAVRRASALAAQDPPRDVFLPCATVAEALAALDAERVDLVVSRWGHGLGRRGDGSRCAEAEVLLAAVAERRARGAAPPVVVFATGEHADENKVAALRAGALAYTATWETLFQTLDAALAPGRETL